MPNVPARKKPKTMAKRPRSKSLQKFSKRYPARKAFVPIAPRPAGANSANVDFIYTSKFGIDPATLGVVALHQFRLNSLFDPDLTGVGTQPVGFDQYAALYEKYRVYEASYKVSFYNGQTRPLIVGCQTCDDASTTTDLERLIQNGQCEWGILTPTGGSADLVTLTGTVDLAAAQGQTKAQFWSDDVNEALMSANPTEAYTLNVFAADINISDPAGIVCYIEIRYKARLYGNVLTVTS